MSSPKLEDASDADLVQHCRQGSQVAWQVLVRRFQRLIYTVPRRAGLSEAQAADVFQTVFTRLFEHLDRVEDPARVRAWLVTTAKRESLRLVEQQRRTVALDAPAGAPGADDGPESGEDGLAATLADPGLLPDELLADLQLQHRLQQALARMDARSRLVIELMFLQDETPSYSEIARRLDLQEGSIGPTRARCLARLRKLMLQP